MDHFSFEPDNNHSLPSPPPPSEFDSAWLLSRIEMILAGYRKADYHDPEAFMMQAAMNLIRFPKAVIEHVSAPTTGIQTRSQWPPSLAEIVEACRAEQAFRAKVAAAASLPPVLPAPLRPRFSIEQCYAVMTGKHGRPIGPFEARREFPYGA